MKGVTPNVEIIPTLERSSSKERCTTELDFERYKF